MPNHSFADIKELSYTTYQQRQRDHVHEDNLPYLMRQIRVGDKFIYSSNGWSKTPYPGFAIVSMVNDQPGNKQVYQKMCAYRDQLEDLLPGDGICYLLPQESYHQTVANTLSAGRYHKYLVEQGLVSKYPDIVRQAFDSIKISQIANPIQMRLIGFSVFGSSMGLLGIFDSERDYEVIQQFRDEIYHHDMLNRLDVRRTRPFIGHITYAYFGPSIMDYKSELTTSLIQLNREIEKEHLVVQFAHTQLRGYDDLSHFSLKASYPTYRFYPHQNGI